MRGISVVVPAYNSSKTLRVLVSRVSCALSELAGDFELIVVDDGSEDNTWETIIDLACENRWFVGMKLSGNFGQHNALLCGITIAKFEICVTVDDDLQHPPEEIPKLIEKIRAGRDLVYGIPVISRHGFVKRRTGAFARSFARHCLRIPQARYISAFRAFRTDLRDGFDRFPGPFVSLDALLCEQTRAWGTVEFNHQSRLTPKSSYSFRKLTELALTLLLGFKPMTFKFALALFFCVTVAGILCSAQHVLASLSTEQTFLEGFIEASIGVALMVAILLTCPVPARYTFRLFFKCPQSETYIVEKTVSQRPNK